VIIFYNVHKKSEEPMGELAPKTPLATPLEREQLKFP